jgi:predicted dehydrogenase
MAEMLRAAVVGVGYLGRFHAQKYAALEDVNLVAVVDNNRDRAEGVAAECGCAALSDYHELAGKVDLVSVVVNTVCHRDVAGFFLDQGVDVLLEKPITVSLAEADELLAKAKKNKCILQTGHLERFNPAVRAMRARLDSPALIETTRVATFKNRGVDVSVVLDLMIHDIDIILSMIDAPLKSISAAGAATVTPNTDTASAWFEFTNGAVATLTASRVSPINERRMQVLQPGGRLDVNFAERSLFSVKSDGMKDGQPHLSTEEERFDSADALFDEICAFVGHVRERSRPEASGEEGRAALAVALEVMEKIKAGAASEAFNKFSSAVP